MLRAARSAPSAFIAELKRSAKNIMNRKPLIVLKIVGVFSIICALLGLYYNVSGLVGHLQVSSASSAEAHRDMPYFQPAYYAMSFICVVSYVLLFVFGLNFIRCRIAHFWPFTILPAFEFIYLFLVSMLWLVPELGKSVAGATGIANGGMMVQFIVFFPLWAPLLVFWARRKINIQNQGLAGI